MKRIKRAVAVLLAVMMVFSVIGCGGSSGSKKSDSSSKETKDAKTEEVWGDKSGQDEICGDPDGKYTIGVVIHTTTDFLCAKYKAYTDYLGKAYGVKFNYYIIENFADETYLSAIENLCAQGVDGIITTNFSGTAVFRMDLSAGAVVMLSAMFGAKMVYLYGIGLIPFALIVVGVGIVLGTISGVMYMLLRVPAIVTALGVCMVYETLSNLASISWVTAINGEITTLGRFPYCLSIFAIMFVLFYIIFNYTKFGYNVRACASSQRIAKNSGVNTKKTAFLCYVVSSLFLGVAALLKISIQGSIDTPMYMSSTNIIFNCMLGIYVGLALEQYCNLVIGIFIGNFILNMLTTGLLSMGLSASLQDTASGIFLLVIMIFTYNNQRVMNFISERKLKKELVRTNAQ